MNRLYRLATASMIAIIVAVSSRPASAQLVVFDPNNYALRQYQPGWPFPR